MDKRAFKAHLEDFVEPAFYCCNMATDESAGIGSGRLAAAAAEQCLTFLAQYLGPNILRGRVEQVTAGLFDVSTSPPK